MALLLALMLSAFAASSARATETEAIYGVDDRREVDDPRNADAMRDAARSVAIVVPRSKILAAVSGDDPQIYRSLPTTTFQTKFNACPSEAFVAQPAPGYCTSFLVGTDIMVTAGHCVKSGADCANSAFVFDFFAGTDIPRPERIRKQNVYHCRGILAHARDRDSGVDFTVLRVNRAVQGRRPLLLRREGQIEGRTPVTVLGHPSGLPQKIAAGGTVRPGNALAYFVVNSDTFSGSSGSPVLNDDGIVEGVLVRGEADFVTTTQGCNVVRRCAENGCRGEDVVRSDTFREWVPSGILQ